MLSENILILQNKDMESTSKDFARDAMSLAPKSIPAIEAIPATNAANTAAYLHMSYT